MAATTDTGRPTNGRVERTIVDNYVVRVQPTEYVDAYRDYDRQPARSRSGGGMSTGGVIAICTAGTIAFLGLLFALSDNSPVLNDKSERVATKRIENNFDLAKLRLKADEAAERNRHSIRIAEVTANKEVALRRSAEHETVAASSAEATKAVAMYSQPKPVVVTTLYAPTTPTVVAAPSYPPASVVQTGFVPTTTTTSTAVYGGGFRPISGGIAPAPGGFAPTGQAGMQGRPTPEQIAAMVPHQITKERVPCAQPYFTNPDGTCSANRWVQY